MLQDLFGFVSGDWQTWAAPAVGLVSTGLTLFMGCRVMGRRVRPVAASANADLLSLDRYQSAFVVEERATPRRSGNTVPVLISNIDAQSPPSEGLVIDRSVGGLGVTTYRPAEPGTILTVRPVNAPMGTPWIEVEVRTCNAQGGRWRIGCEFVHTPTWNILLHFG